MALNDLEVKRAAMQFAEEFKRAGVFDLSGVGGAVSQTHQPSTVQTQTLSQEKKHLKNLREENDLLRRHTNAIKRSTKTFEALKVGSKKASQSIFNVTNAITGILVSTGLKQIVDDYKQSLKFGADAQQRAGDALGKLVMSINELNELEYASRSTVIAMGGYEKWVDKLATRNQEYYAVLGGGAEATKYLATNMTQLATLAGSTPKEFDKLNKSMRGSLESMKLLGILPEQQQELMAEVLESATTRSNILNKASDAERRAIMLSINQRHLEMRMMGMNIEQIKKANTALNEMGQRKVFDRISQSMDLFRGAQIAGIDPGKAHRMSSMFRKGLRTEEDKAAFTREAAPLANRIQEMLGSSDLNTQRRGEIILESVEKAVPNFLESFTTGQAKATRTDAEKLQDLMTKSHKHEKETIEAVRVADKSIKLLTENSVGAITYYGMQNLELGESMLGDMKNLGRWAWERLKQFGQMVAKWIGDYFGKKFPHIFGEDPLEKEKRLERQYEGARGKQKVSAKMALDRFRKSEEFLNAKKLEAASFGSGDGEALAGMMGNFGGGGLTQQGAPAGASGAAVGAGSKNILNMISAAEGTTDKKAMAKQGVQSGYDVTLGYGAYDPAGPHKPVSQMSLGELKRFQGKMLRHTNNKMNSSAVGRYQIVRKTLIELQKRYGIPDSAIFTPQLQDALALGLLEQRGVFKAQRGDVAQNRAATIWASIPRSDTGRSHYATSHSQPTGTTTTEVQDALAGVANEKQTRSSIIGMVRDVVQKQDEEALEEAKKTGKTPFLTDVSENVNKPNETLDTLKQLNANVESLLQVNMIGNKDRKTMAKTQEASVFNTSSTPPI